MADRFVWKFTEKNKKRYPNIAREFPDMEYHENYYYKYSTLEDAIEHIKKRNERLVHMRIILITDNKRRVVYKR